MHVFMHIQCILLNCNSDLIKLRRVMGER
jgi:hypothetical protein